MGILNIALIIGGIIIITQGAMLIKSQSLQKINPTQCRYIKPNDVKTFTLKSGLTVVLLGASAIISVILNMILQSNLAYITLGVGFILYVTILLILQSKYNKEPQN